VASIGEVGLITVQAWRQVPSHFNLETSFDGLVARGLAAGGAILVAVLITLFVLSGARNPSCRRCWHGASGSAWARCCSRSPSVPR